MMLFGIAKNVLRNHSRSAIRSASLFDVLQLERCEDSNPAESAVLEALTQLRPDDREVLLLTYWDGFSSTEVSDLLNTSATAVRMRLHRARKTLSQLLEAQTASEGAEK